MAYLILVRHGESEWNAKGVWTGLNDVSLTEKGREEARKAALFIKDIKIDVAFISSLTRAKETLDEIRKVLNLENVEILENAALNERDYGNYAGQNKWKVKEKVGEENFKKIRRGWDFPIPNGESLKDVYNRVIPYYKNYIVNKIIENKNVLISAHGNSLRALIKYLENIKDEDIPFLEMTTGEVYIYKMDDQGNVISKEIKKTNSIVP